MRSSEEKMGPRRHRNQIDDLLILPAHALNGSLDLLAGFAVRGRVESGEEEGSITAAEGYYVAA
jgi:hypothetical protein